MSHSGPYIKNMRIDSSIQMVEESISNLQKSISDINQVDGAAIESLESRVRALMGKAGVPTLQNVALSGEKVEIVHSTNDAKDPVVDYDTVIACVAGGLAVLVDFIAVKIPKNATIVREGQYISQHGSPITGFLRQIGFTSDGKTSKWVKTLEGFFKVNYDKSVIPGEVGFSPRSHRIYSAAHDPSPSGLLWALKDAVCGTISYIDKNGVLKSVPTYNISAWRIFATPIIWIGHIISDIFTKAGVPIPGYCLLRTLQFGSFGEKARTIGQVVEYMYLEGYDLRHLATMAVENAVIELIIRIYHILTKPIIEQFARPQALIQADRELQDRRLHSMRLKAYAIASCGNVAKLAVYQWNPTALNIAVWAECARTAIKEYSRRHGRTQDALDAISQRQLIDEKFDEIEAKINSI